MIAQLALAALLAACAGAGDSGSSASSSARTGLGTATGTGTAAASHPDAAPPASPPDAGKGTAMQTDFKPNLAFRDYAAKKLGVSPDQVQGGATDAATAAKMPNSIGGAWAYTMVLASDPTRDVRGWVTADATVITPDQNLGLLFEQAGTWTKAPIANASQLAQAIAWSYGMNNRVVIAPETGAAAPRITLMANGSGTFRFVLGYRAPGPGGAGGGPEDLYQIAVAFTADHQATLTRTPLQAP